MKTNKPFRLALISAAFALVSGGCVVADDAPLDWLRPAGPIARDIGNLWTLVFYAAVIVFFLVEGAIVYSLFKFRRRPGDTEAPKQVHGNTRLEIAWTIAPALLLAVLAVPTLSGIFSLAAEPQFHDQSTGERGALKVTVTGQQWWWRYDYTDAKVVTANELHIPTGRPVRLALESTDIIHSFWVPRLAGKQDVIPGKTNYLTLQADRPGEYSGTCVEYCGLSHANMRLKVFAHEPDEFRQWLSQQGEDAGPPASRLAREGQRVFFTKQCYTCHTVEGQTVRVDGTDRAAEGTTGPNLTHFAERTTFAGAIFESSERNLRRWLTDAPAEKPGSKMPAGVAEMGLTEDDIDALIVYLRTLR